MEDRTLIKIAIITSLAGISILFMICNEIGVDESMLSKITSTDSAITVKGSIISIMSYTNSRMVQLEKKEKLNVIVVGQDYIDLSKGDNVEVIGNWNEKMQGNLSMFAKEIRKI